jgi:hypothetical protein
VTAPFHSQTGSTTHPDNDQTQTRYTTQHFGDRQTRLPLEHVHTATHGSSQQHACWWPAAACSADRRTACTAPDPVPRGQHPPKQREERDQTVCLFLPFPGLLHQTAAPHSKPGTPHSILTVNSTLPLQVWSQTHAHAGAQTPKEGGCPSSCILYRPVLDRVLLQDDGCTTFPSKMIRVVQVICSETANSWLVWI